MKEPVRKNPVVVYFIITFLVSYRIIMVWMHERTGSMIPVIILHGVLGTFRHRQDTSQ